jgi:hypothetical protein
MLIKILKEGIIEGLNSLDVDPFVEVRQDALPSGNTHLPAECRIFD